MATMQAVNEKVVDLYPYHFVIYETRRLEGADVIIGVIRLDGRDFTTEDKGILNSMLDDIGKWETFVHSVSTVLNEIGVTSSAKKPSVYAEYAPYSKYNVSGRDEKIQGSSQARYQINLTKEERLRRKEMGLPQLDSAEIFTQLENVAKWKTLSQTPSVIRRSIS